MSKNKKRNEILQILKSNTELTEDSSGNFLTADKENRFKVGAKTLKFEIKQDKWVKISITSFKDIEIKDGKMEVKDFNRK